MFRTLLVGCLLAPVAASAYEVKKDPTGNPVRVAQKEIVFRLPAHVPPGLDAAEIGAAIERALAEWGEVSGLTFKVVRGDPYAKIGYDPKGDNHNDILFIEHGWEWDDTGVAATILTIDTQTHTILDADIALNASEHRFKVLPDSSVPGGVYDDVQNAVAHELGHALGLGHSGVTGSVMYPSSPRGEVTKRKLTEDNVEGIRAIYQPLFLSQQTKADQGLSSDGTSAGCSQASGGVSAVPVLLFAALQLIARRPKKESTMARDRKEARQ